MGRPSGRLRNAVLPPLRAGSRPSRCGLISWRERTVQGPNLLYWGSVRSCASRRRVVPRSVRAVVCLSDLARDSAAVVDRHSLAAGLIPDRLVLLAIHRRRPAATIATTPPRVGPRPRRRGRATTATPTGAASVLDEVAQNATQRDRVISGEVDLVRHPVNPNSTVSSAALWSRSSRSVTTVRCAMSGLSLRRVGAARETPRCVARYADPERYE